MKQFFATVGKSVYSPQFYRELVNRSLGSSFKYFFTLILLCALITTVYVSWSVLPGVYSFLNNAESLARQYYPADVEVKIENRIATSNVAEPYLIKFPEELGEHSSDENRAENLLIIYTAAESIDIKEFRDYDTFALLTSDSLVVRDDRGAIRVLPLDVPDMTINQENIANFVGGISRYSVLIATGLVLIIILGTFIGYVFILVFVLLIALLIWLYAAKFRKWPVGYKKSYQIGLHAITLALLADLAMKPIGFHFPFMFSIITLIVVGINIGSPSQAEPVSVASNQ